MKTAAFVCSLLVITVLVTCQSLDDSDWRQVLANDLYDQQKPLSLRSLLQRRMPSELPVLDTADVIDAMRYDVVPKLAPVKRCPTMACNDDLGPS